MPDAVRSTRQGRVAVLVFDRPPAHALGAEMRAGLLAALEAVDADPQVSAIALLASGTTFPNGADPSETGAARADFDLAAICNRIEATAKPVVAGLHGSVLSGGLEVALGAHYRLAAAGTRLGFPDIRRGLIPCAGGTQRLPCLVGAEAALRLLLDGNIIDAEAAEQVGLIDGVAVGPLESATVSLARRLAAGSAPPRPTRAQTQAFGAPAAIARALLDARERALASPIPASMAVVEAVAAALTRPFDEGLAVERGLATRLAASAEARALDRIARERRIASSARGPAPLPVERIRVSGRPGETGAELVADLVLAGFDVTLTSDDVVGLPALREPVCRALSLRKSGGAAERIKGDAGNGPADLVLCCSGPDRADTGITVDLLEEAAAAPSRGGGAPVIRHAPPCGCEGLIEIAHDGTDARAIASLQAVAARVNRPAVELATAEAGLCGSLFAMWCEAMDHLVEEGAHPHDVDSALESAGFARGPYARADAVGIGTARAARMAAAHARDPRARYPTLADRLCDVGRTGRAVGRGYYLHPPAVDDAELGELLHLARQDAGMAQRRIAPAEIVRRSYLALSLAGARCMAARPGLTAGQVDLAAVAGLGAPVWIGGPMQWRPETGDGRVDAMCAELAATEDPVFWALPLAHSASRREPA